MFTKRLFQTFTLLIALGAANLVNAADLLVRENGLGGAYSTIQAALDASVDGDRVIVFNKAGDVPYVENITISKNITLMGLDKDNKAIINGSITLEKGCSINFVKATTFTLYSSDTIDININHFEGGSISHGYQHTPGSYQNINITNSNFSGNIKTENSESHRTSSGYSPYSTDKYKTLISNCTIEGSVYIANGKILGNTINGSIVSRYYSLNRNYSTLYDYTYIYTKFYAKSDSLCIIGNKVSGGINIFNNRPHLIENNLIKSTSDGIFCYKWDANSSVVNNTIMAGVYGIEIDGDRTTSTLIYNNLIVSHPTKVSSGWAIDCSGAAYVSYNAYTDNFSSTGHTNNGTNLTFPASDVTVDETTGMASGSNINAGHPDAAYTDLDLSRNDIGCYGGSNSLLNFFPTNNTGNARIIHLEIPRRVLNGDQINVKATAIAE